MVKNIYAIGVFDLFHMGHLNHLKKSKELFNNSKLIVGVNSDSSVRLSKRETIIPEDQRKAIIQSLGFVDEAILYDDLDQTKKLEELKINIFAIGPEYTLNKYYSKMMKYCRNKDISVEVISRTEGVSTTDIIRKCFNQRECEDTAKTFWKSHSSYPTYSVDISKRRDHEVDYLLKYINNTKSLLDLGCGDGSLIKILQSKTSIERFYAYELSENLLENLDIDDVEKKVVDLTSNEYSLPKVDTVVCAGVIPYLFENSDILKMLRKLQTKKLFIRTPCTMKDNDELVDTFSKDLDKKYSALYRTVENVKTILSTYFEVEEVIRIYPDELESKYGTKQYYFRCFSKELNFRPFSRYIN